MKVVFSWDDGAIEDQKLFEIHEKYQIPGMFFVPTKNREGRDVLTPEMIRKAKSENIAFGGHTYNHVYLTEISLQEAEQEVKMNKEWLEDILQEKVNHFCLPGGKFNEEILHMVSQHYQTIRTADTMHFTNQEGVIKPTIHFYPRGWKSLCGNAWRQKSFRQLAYVMTKGNRDYFSIVRGLLEKEKKEDSTVVIWGHSWELEEYCLWTELEEFMKWIGRENSFSYEEVFGDRRRNE